MRENMVYLTKGNKSAGRAHMGAAAGAIVLVVCILAGVWLITTRKSLSEQILARVEEPHFAVYYGHGRMGLIASEALLWAEKVNEEGLDLMPHFLDALEKEDTQKALGLAYIMIKSESAPYMEHREGNPDDVPMWEWSLLVDTSRDMGTKPDEKYRERIRALLEASDNPVAQLYRADFYGTDPDEGSREVYLELMERNDWVGLRAAANLLKNRWDEERAARRMRELAAQGVELCVVKKSLLEDYESRSSADQGAEPSEESE